MEDIETEPAFFARFSKRNDELEVLASTLDEGDYARECDVAERSFIDAAAGRLHLILEVRRRVQERRLSYWLDRPGNDDRVRQSLLARCALGFEAPWHEAEVFLRAIRYLSVGTGSDEARILLDFVTARLLLEHQREPSIELTDVLAICQRQQ